MSVTMGIVILYEAQHSTLQSKGETIMKTYLRPESSSNDQWHPQPSGRRGRLYSINASNDSYLLPRGIHCAKTIAHYDL